MTDKLAGISPPQDPLAGLYNIEAEQALIGAVMLNNKVFEHVADLVSAEDFGMPAYCRLWQAIESTIAAGMKADALTLRVAADAIFDNGGAHLARLYECAVTVINGLGYATVIHDLAQRREIVTAAQDIIADAAHVVADRASDAVLDEAEQRLYEIAERGSRNDAPRPLADVLTQTVEGIGEAYRQGGVTVLYTGLADLDHILSGLAAGELIVLAGRPSMGKSAAAGSVALNCARNGKRVLIFSLEMTRGELAQRWLAGLTGVSTDAQRLGRIETQQQWDRIAEAQADLARLPLWIDDQPRLSVAQMRQRARRVKRRHGLDLIVIDHLQLVRQGGRQESRRLEIGDATGMLKAVAKELGVPILLLSQLNRAVEQRDDKRPMLSDLRESGDIEQDADAVLLLYREEYYLARSEPRRRPNESNDAFAARCADHEDRRREARGIAEIHVAKNRHGRTGTVRVHFNAERQRFENLADDGYGRSA